MRGIRLEIGAAATPEGKPPKSPGGRYFGIGVGRAAKLPGAMWPPGLSPRLLGALMLILAPLSLTCSCVTYLHNPGKAALAKDTSEEFKKFQAASPQLNAAMLQNVQKVELKASKRQAEITAEIVASFADQVHTVTWEQVEKELEAAKAQQVQRQQAIKDAVKDILKKMGEAKPKVDNAEDGLRQVSKLLKKAIDKENQWQARQVLFRESIQFMAQVAAENLKLEPSILEAKKREILGKEINIVFLASDDNLKTTYSTLEQVLASDTDAFNNLFDPRSAPGLTVTILSLAEDLAKVQCDRAELQVWYLGAKYKALKVQMAQMENSQKNIETALVMINDRLGEGSFLPRDTALTTINKLHKTGKQNAIIAAGRATTLYGVIKILDESARLELQARPDILDHEYSIRLATINGKEHEALISRGLQSLVIYHEGGVKPEMIANFIRATQTVALAVIGAGVL